MIENLSVSLYPKKGRNEDTGMLWMYTHRYWLQQLDLFHNEEDKSIGFQNVHYTETIFLIKSIFSDAITVKP